MHVLNPEHVLLLLVTCEITSPEDIETGARRQSLLSFIGMRRSFLSVLAWHVPVSCSRGARRNGTRSTRSGVNRLPELSKEWVHLAGQPYGKVILDVFVCVCVTVYSPSSLCRQTVRELVPRRWFAEPRLLLCGCQ